MNTDFLSHKVTEMMDLYFRGILDRQETEYTEEDISNMITEVLKENPWETFVREYDLRDKITDKPVPVLDLLPDDIDPEYMWIIDGHILVCIDYEKLIQAL